MGGDCMGQLILWTSIQGFKNVSANKQFFAYSNKTKQNSLQIIVPMSAVCTFQESGLEAEGIEFHCFQKELW
jgi:hypothetical protein